MILESCRRAAPRAAKPGVRTAVAAVGCFCLLAAASFDAGGLGPIGGGLAQAAGDAPKARELFRQGSVFFDSGQFGKAIEAWQRAYEEKQDPGLLYNIGQAYRLAGDPRKALFFYRSFLRKTPRSAPERADAEQKIGALQAQIAAEDEQKDRNNDQREPQPKAQAAASAGQPLATPPPSAPTTAPAAETPAEMPSPAAAGAGPEPARASAPAGPAAGPSADDLQPARVPSSPGSVGGGVRDELRAPSDPIDFGLGPGVTTWLAGPATGRRSAFAATALLGYTFGDDDRDARLRFRLGALVQYASLHEPNGTDTFLDVLIAPTMRVRVWEQRLFVSLDLGVGFLVLAGLKPSSDFLAHNQASTAVGTQSIFELRPGATVTYRLYPAVELFAGPALAWNPKKPHFHEPMLRLQLSGGVALRF